MRIAYLLNTLATGGAERQVVALAGCMQARGHAVEVFTLRAPAEEEFAAPAPVRRLGITKNPFTLARGFVRGVRLLRTFHPDILVANNIHANLLARALRVFVPRAALVSVIHNENEGGRLRMLALRLSDPLSDGSVAVCGAAAAAAIRRGAVPANKCSAIANGIDCAEFAADENRRVQTRAQAGVGEEFVWLATGRLAPAKNYPGLLRAFAQVRAESPQAILWIAGAGEQIYGDQLRELADELCLGNTIRWLGVRSDIPALLDAADGFVLSSAWEGMPLALGEAMAMEKPIVAVKVGGVRELAGECAALVPEGNPAELAAAMIAVMQLPPDARREMGRAARRRVVQSFSQEKSAGQWEELYQRVLRKRGGA